MPKDFILNLIPLIGVVLLVIQFLIGKYAKKPWLKYILPALWLLFAAFLAVKGALSGLSDFILVLIGFFILIVFGQKGQDTNK